jgi:LCP family protein required for cell wall assembly
MKKFIFWFLISLVVLGAGIGAFAYYKVDKVTSKIYQTEKQSGADGKKSTNTAASDQKTSQSSSVSYLLLGTDTGALGRSYTGLTDSIMVLTLSPSRNKATLVSLQRDTLVNISGSSAKLNAAYSYGGANGAMTAVENLLNINLDGYFLVNMKGIQSLVDSVGGVTVTSPLTFNFDSYSFTAGQSTALSGKKALAFSRMRHDDPRGDYGRQIRQQLIVTAVIKKLQSNPTSALSDNFLNAVGNNVRTDVSLTSFKNLATNYASLSGSLSTDQMVGTSKMINGVSYQLMSNDEIQRIHNEISGTN